MRYPLTMADGAMNLNLTDYTASKIVEKAKAMGVAPEDLAAMVLDAKFFDYDDFTWINGDPRDHKLEPSDLEGARDWDEVRPEFLAQIEKTFDPE